MPHLLMDLAVGGTPTLLFCRFSLATKEHSDELNGVNTEVAK